jgi:hypothetical protein
MKFQDNLPIQLVPAWQLSGLQTRPVKDFLPYSRNEWKNIVLPWIWFSSFALI